MQRAIARAQPDALMELIDRFPEGSTRPNVVAACEFVTGTGNRAAIGRLSDIGEMMTESVGTVVIQDQDGVSFCDETSTFNARHDAS